MVTNSARYLISVMLTLIVITIVTVARIDGDIIYVKNTGEVPKVTREAGDFVQIVSLCLVEWIAGPDFPNASTHSPLLYPQ